MRSIPSLKEMGWQDLSCHPFMPPGRVRADTMSSGYGHYLAGTVPVVILSIRLGDAPGVAWRG